MNLVERIKKELEEFNKKKQSLVEELRVEFPKLFKELLEQSTVIESFSWTQYSPYFNDGDECTFSVNNSDISINGFNEDDYDEDDEEQEKLDFLETEYKEIKTQEELNYVNSSYYKIGDKAYLPVVSFDDINLKVYLQIKQLLTSIPDDFYEDLFGNHVEVTVYKSGKINVEEYSHD